MPRMVSLDELKLASAITRQLLDEFAILGAENRGVSGPQLLACILEVMETKEQTPTALDALRDCEAKFGGNELPLSAKEVLGRQPRSNAEILARAVGMTFPLEP